MSTIKKELAAFIQAHTQEHFAMTPISMREGSQHTAWSQELPKVPLARIIDTVFTGCGEYDLPVRIYIPDTSRPLKVMVFYHGGGLAVDTVSVYDPICRRLADATGYLVVSVEYRLAPENKYPAATHDALAAARQVFANLTALHLPFIRDLTVCGDSAGGYLAAAVSAALQNEDDIPLTHQVLIYPCLDFTHQFPSVAENCNVTTGFTKQKLHWYFDQYFRPGDDRRQASPLFQPLTEKMPATLVVTVEYCPFRDEGREYVRRLQKLGVRAESYHYENMVHSYLNFEKLCFDEICDTYHRIAQFLTK